MTCKGCEERDKTIERMTALLVLDEVCPRREAASD